jgi:DNA helicase II / ATP-dependent DNA helicase PcrA
MSTERTPPPTKALNAAQQAAVATTERPVLVLAGPGTGKTKMLVAKYAHLVLDKGLKPERILITTFTTKATAELEERIGHALAAGKMYSKVEVQNFHSFCLRLLQEFGSEIGLRRDPPVLDGVALTRFLFDNKDRFTWEHVPYIRYPQGPLENLVRFTSRCLSEGFTPEEAMRRTERYVARVDADDRAKALEYTDYARNYAAALALLEEKHVITYDLMLFHAVRLMDARADIRKQVQARFDYLLVDEVQDNNGLQTRLIELLAGGRPIVTVVGDEDQGIYKFRGARRDNLHHIEATFKPEVVNLWENYRSTPAILAGAKAVIGNNTDRFAGKRLEARGRNAASKAPIEVLAFPNEAQEAIRIATLIEDELAKGRRPKDIAVIFRSLNHKDHLLGELEARAIPYEVAQHGELLRLREVRDLWAWMSVLNDPYTDNPAFARVLSSREVGIDLLDLGRVKQRLQRQLEEKAKEEGKDPDLVRVNLVDVLRDLEGAHITDESRHQLRWARRTLEVLSDRARGLGALDTAYEILGWLKPQNRYPPGEESAQQVWLNLGRFLQVVKEYEQGYPDAAGLPGFLAYLDYLDRQDADFADSNVDEAQDSVKLLTAHGSKGLEFPVVILASCCKQRFPGQFRGDWMHPILDPDGKLEPAELHVAEERRVFYVAMTRAQERLVITHPLTIGGKERARGQFIDELVDGAGEHVSCETITEELPPASAQTAADQAWQLELHGAITVHDKVDLEEARDRIRRVIEATLKAWSGTVSPKVAEGIVEATKPLGVTLPATAPPPAKEARRLVLTASALNTYADCPRKFQFQQVLRIPQRIKGAAVAGSNVHRALEVFHREHQADWRKCTTEQLIEVYDRVSAEGRFADPKEAAQWRERDLRILREYLDTERQTPGDPTHFEVPFEYEVPGLDAGFFGYIDRVDEHPDGTVEIVDYKTGGRDSPNKIVTEDFQIPLYVLAFEEGKGRKVKAGTLYWMREAGDGKGPIVRDRIVRVKEGKKGTFSDAAVQAFHVRLRKAVQGIREERFEEKPDDFGCSFCDYRLICPAWGG